MDMSPDQQSKNVVADDGESPKTVSKRIWKLTMKGIKAPFYQHITSTANNIFDKPYQEKSKPEIVSGFYT